MNPYRYSNGRSIPLNVVEAIRFTGKVGFLSRALWHEFFGISKKRWSDQQIQLLVERGYFKKHRNPELTNHWVLADRGMALLAEVKGPRVTPVPSTYLNHDGFVARSMMTLKRANLINAFQVERELKTYGVKHFLVSENDGDQKYPDAVFKINAYGGIKTVALEYEKERKALSRYRSVLFQYAAITNLSMVLFIVEDSGTRKMIESAMKYLGQTALSSKLAFTYAEDWKKSPLTAPISLRSNIVKLGEICTPLGGK